MVRRNIGIAKDVMREFKEKQQLIHQSIKPPKIRKGTSEITRGFDEIKETKKTNSTNHYERYLYKLHNGLIDKFTVRDIMYFFKDTANEHGVKYVIANYKVDMAAFKMCLDRGYTVEEILTMIEFLFASDQDYLDKRTITPNILKSSWVNRIYQDSQLWLKDQYVNSKNKKFKNREWTGEVTTEETAKIDEWGF